MLKTFVIIITGLPGTGKTTLGKHLARRYRLPFVHKDGIKEVLFDAFEKCTPDLSRKLGLSSILLLHYFTETLLNVGQSVIVEANFNPALATPEWLALKEKCDFNPFQILCFTEGEVLVERFIQRIGTNERHPGHPDRVDDPNLKLTLIQGRQENLKLGGQVYELDTTDFEQIDYQALYAALELEMQLRPIDE